MKLAGGDVVVLVAAAALVTGAWFAIFTPGVAADTVRIQSASGGTEDYPLSENRSIRVQGPLGETRIEIRDRRVAITHSPCQQKICLRSGWLSAGGEVSACVPNRVAVTLAAHHPEFDAVNF